MRKWRDDDGFLCGRFELPLEHGGAIVEAFFDQVTNRMRPKTGEAWEPLDRRQADVLICTGPVTRQARARLLRTYEQMPEPRRVMAVGSCGISGAAFRGCYNVLGGVDEVIPVDVYVPGCPPRPEAIVHGLLMLLEAR